MNFSKFLYYFLLFFFQLPLDVTTLSESERQIRLMRRKPKQKIVIEEEIEDSFDVNRYSHLWKK